SPQRLAPDPTISTAGSVVHLSYCDRSADRTDPAPAQPTPLGRGFSRPDDRRGLSERPEAPSRPSLGGMPDSQPGIEGDLHGALGVRVLPTEIPGDFRRAIRRHPERL